MQTEMFVGFKCPNCQTHNATPCSSIEETNGASTNCVACDHLFLIEDGVVKDFHKTLNEENPIWPKDGTGVESISIG